MQIDDLNLTEDQQKELLSELLDKHQEEALNLLKEKRENEDQKASTEAFESFLTEKFGGKS